MQQKNLIVRKITVPATIPVEKDLLVESLPTVIKKCLLRSSCEPVNTFQLYFLIKSETYSFMITALYFGKDIQLVIPREDRIVAPLATVKCWFEGIVEAIQKHIGALLEAEEAVRLINNINI